MINFIKLTTILLLIISPSFAKPDLLTKHTPIHKEPSKQYIKEKIEAVHEDNSTKDKNPEVEEQFGVYNLNPLVWFAIQDIKLSREDQN